MSCGAGDRLYKWICDGMVIEGNRMEKDIRDETRAPPESLFYFSR